MDTAFQGSDIGYRISDIGKKFYPISYMMSDFALVRSDIGGFDIRLSPILFVMCVGLIAHLFLRYC
jgi:hypothetical protein